MDCLGLAPDDDTVAPGAFVLRDAEDEGRQIAMPATIAVESVTTAGLEPVREAWADLARRALDPNVFLEPAFAFPLLQHLGSRRKLSILLVWDRSGPAFSDRLLGVFPLAMPASHRPISLARVFTHEQTTCGTPLVDRVEARAVFEAVAAWLGAHRSRPDGLLLTGVAQDGAFATALQSFAAETDRSIAVLDVRERAALCRRDEHIGSVTSFASAKRRKERKRQYRRLSELGQCTYVTAKAPQEVAVAMERFLAIEDRGWKGARGTSLLGAPFRATFARTMARLMAREGKCRIDAIEIDGKPVAMGVVLTQGDRAYYWKTAFDEAYAPYSPGVQLTLELTRTQLANSSVAMTDSCAVANHPMINRLWPDRTVALDMVLSVRAADRARFDRSVRLERWRRALRQRLKALWQNVRQRRGD